MRPNGLFWGLTALYATASFAEPEAWVDTYGYESGGWETERYTQVLADVNADSRADVIGFGDAGVYVSLSTGNGFTPPKLWLDNFGYEAGNWRVERHPRFVADVNADQRADIVGFGDAGVLVSLSTGSGFTPSSVWLDDFGYEASGWRIERHPRFVADVNADQRADVVGFGVAGVFVSLSTGSGFSPPKLWVNIQDDDARD